MSHRHHTALFSIHLSLREFERLDDLAAEQNLSIDNYLRDLILNTLGPQPTPTSITFQEITMNPTEAGQSQVFTIALAPTGSAFPAGTTYTVTSNDPAVSPSLDATGLILSVTYPAVWAENTTTPLAFEWATSTFVPSPSTSPSSLNLTITPSAPPASAVTPTSVSYTQTT